MRLFVSVDLPDSVAEAVADAQARFDGVAGLSFTDPTQAHLTLKFLGAVADERVPNILTSVERAVDTAGVAPFEATVGGFGVFPSAEYIRVLWVGFESGGPELTRLHDALERETTALGFDAESHEFTPHVTLARMRDARGKETVQRIVRESSPTLGTFTVSEVRLKRSTLTPDGPDYETLARVTL